MGVWWGSWGGCLKTAEVMTTRWWNRKPQPLFCLRKTNQFDNSIWTKILSWEFQNPIKKLQYLRAAKSQEQLLWNGQEEQFYNFTQQPHPKLPKLCAERDNTPTWTFHPGRKGRAEHASSILTFPMHKKSAKVRGAHCFIKCTYSNTKLQGPWRTMDTWTKPRNKVKLQKPVPPKERKRKIKRKKDELPDKEFKSSK